MNNSIKVTGIVLSSMDYEEDSRIVRLLTRELGKVTAFARGARKPKGAFGGRTESFSFGEFSLLPAGDAYRLTGAEITNYFGGLREDYGRICRGMYFCEVCGYFAQEGQEAGGLLKLLYMTLSALEKDRMDPALLRSVFEMRLLTLEGEGVEVTECVACRKPYAGGDTWFGLHEGGILCDDCRMADSEPVHEGTVRALSYICHAPFEKLFSFELTEERRKELCDIAGRYFKLHVDKTFKSEEMYGI